LAAQSRAITTVVVDDSPNALRAMCSLVAGEPSLSIVGSATNGREALAIARTLRPDLVLLDLEMPVMDGLEVTSHLGRECPATRVVIVTVHDTPGLRALCCKQGASAFIGKDTLKDDLRAVVLRLFGDAE
jgi:DNA-binding NarL/FixJ family response regulator